MVKVIYDNNVIIRRHERCRSNYRMQNNAKCAISYKLYT